MSNTTLTILGCGSSGGVPRLGGHWGDCDPTNPKNTRRRCSVLIERTGPEGKTKVLVDTSPDLRQQLLDARVGRLDGVVYTHAHADHVHGIDDLRMIVFNTRSRLDVWATPQTQEALTGRFDYAFVQPEGSPYPPILNMQTLDAETVVHGPGGPVPFTPFEIDHGMVHTVGLKIGNLVYLPDVATLPEDAWAFVQDLDIWIVDALRRTPHPTHSHLEQTLGWIKHARPNRAILTNMHIDLDYETLRAETPAHVEPAFDGMQIDFELD